MAKKMQGQPMVIMGEDAQRLLGRDAQRMNIMAARIVGELVKSTLGPKGMDKMLVDTLGDIVVTGDGVTILKEMEIEHPAAKMVVEVAKVQEDEVGDGTTTAVVLCGSLLKESEELLNQRIHPAVIANGYRLAAAEAQRVLEKISITIKSTDTVMLENIVKTTMSGRVTDGASEHLSKLVVRGVQMIAEEVDGKIIVDVDDMKIEKKAGGNLKDTELVEGVVIDKERVHSNMPRVVNKAKIAVLNTAIEIEKTETDAEIRITSPEQLDAFMKKEESMLKGMVEKIKASEANVVFCQKGIDDLAQHYMAKAGLLVVRRVKESDISRLSKATGASIVTNLDDINKDDLGHAKIVEELKLGGESMIFVRGCKNPKAVTLLVHGGTSHIVDEAERSLSDAIKVVACTLETLKVLAGGGAPEIEASLKLRKYANKVGGREALAIEAFADALEIIPRALAENGGMDPIDVLVKLKSAHEKGAVTYGVNVLDGKTGDLKSQGVFEPLKVKSQAIKAASEAAMMILKIDDVVAAGDLKGGGGMPGGGMPPGMPPGMM